MMRHSGQKSRILRKRCAGAAGEEPVHGERPAAENGETGEQENPERPLVEHERPGRRIEPAAEIVAAGAVGEDVGETLDDDGTDHAERGEARNGTEDDE